MFIRNVGDVGALVRQRRESREMTQAALAEAVGVSRPWVIDLEAGAKGANIGKVIEVLQVLDLTLDISPDDTDPFADVFAGLTP